MTQSYYSWYGTRLHFIFDDEVAAAFNRAADKFKDAQLKFKAEYGRDWNPTSQPLDMGWTDEEFSAWNNVAKIINFIVDVNGGTLDIMEEELTSDHLEKL